MAFLRRRSNWERLTNNAAGLADRATVGNPSHATVMVRRGASNDMVAALDDEMEKRSYYFAGWLTPGTISYEFRSPATIERAKQLQDATVFYAQLVNIVTDIGRFRHPMELEGHTSLRVTKDELILGAELHVPTKNVAGYDGYKRSETEFLGAIVLQGGVSGKPGPTALVAHLAAPGDFEPAMRKVGLQRVHVPQGVYWART